MNPFILKLLLTAPQVIPAVIEEVRKVGADAKGATSPEQKVKNILADLESVLGTALKVL